MDFVVGYMRESLSNRVIMVRKTKPAFQAGLLNGVGGKVDHWVDGFPGRRETPLEAMVREFREETGIETTPDEWRLIMYMQDTRDFYTEEPCVSEPGTVYWFACTRRFLPKLPARVLDSGEELLTINMHDLPNRNDCLATVRWVVPMAFLDPTLQVIGSDEHVLKRAEVAKGATIAVDPVGVPKESPYIWRANTGPTYNGITKGDVVTNKAGTETGVVHAFGHDGKVAWVNSSDSPSKWVTMYVEDLRMVGVSGATGPVGPRYTAKPWMADYSRERDGVTVDSVDIQIDPVDLTIDWETNSKLQRDGVVTDGCNGRTRPKGWRPDDDASYLARLQEVALKKGLHFGAVGHVTGEPAEAPDAPWVKAQNDFGGRVVTADKLCSDEALAVYAYLKHVSSRTPEEEKAFVQAWRVICGLAERSISALGAR